MLPVSVDSQESLRTVPSPQTDRVVRDAGVIGVDDRGARVLLRGSVDPANVSRVLMAHIDWIDELLPWAAAKHLGRGTTEPLPCNWRPERTL